MTKHRARAMALAGYLAAMLVLFRDVLASGFDRGFGDRMDAMIEMSILEHWRSVFMGRGDVEPAALFPSLCRHARL